MHPFIVSIIILCDMFLFVAIVSSQSQLLVSPPPPPRQRPRGGGHHGPKQGHHYQGKGLNFHGGHQAPVKYLPSTPNSNIKQNQNPIPNQNQGTPPLNQIKPPSLPSNPNQNQNENQNQHQNHNHNQNQNPNTSPDQIKGGADDLNNQNQKNNKNPGRLFGWAPKNNTASSNSRVLLADEFLHAHNWVRDKYNLPPYTWDVNLESFARKYLMQRYNDCLMVHSKNPSYGENMFWGQRLHWTPSDVVYFWYMEKEAYDFKTLKCSPLPLASSQTAPKTCGHFTQIVWRDSIRVGCALQHCNDRSAGMLVACEYDPPGNYDDENPLEQHS